MFVVIMQFSLFSQRIYFKGQIGYDIGFLKSQISLSSEDIKTYYDSTIVTNTYQAYRNSFGTGVSFNAGLGLMITKYIAVDLVGFYTVCKQQELQSEVHMQDVLGYKFNGYSNYTMQGTVYGIKPALTFTMPGKKLRPYTRIGAIISMTSLNEYMKMNVTTDNPNYLPWGGMEYTLKYKKRLTVGLNLAVGLEYLILQRLWLYAEIDGNIVNYSPTGATYTQYIVSREDITSMLTVHDKEILFVDSYGDKDNKSDNEPTKMLPVHYSFSSIGFNIGLKFTLFD
jgi:hypothetical protein